MTFDSLSGWLDWQARLHPRQVDLGLERVRQVWERLGAPAPGATVITVAGTNGKGSSVAFAEAILQAAGYRVGCYTSPHLQRYNERIRIDLQAVDDASICTAFERIEQARGGTSLTYFEFGTLAALLLFAEAGLDAAVLEVGLGGRLDAVNIIDPDVALITAIGLDHMAWLGDDIEQIGAEKAGILRAGRPAVFSGPVLPDSIRHRAKALDVALRVAGEDFRIERRPDAWDLMADTGGRRALPLPGLRGNVQLANAAGVLIALDCVAERLPVDQQAVRSGLLAARVPGRFEVRPGAPTWVLDVAHNPQAAATLSDSLGDVFCRGRIVAVLGMLDDKDVRGVVDALAGRVDRWYLVDLSGQSRGLSSSQLAQRIGEPPDASQMIVGGAVDGTLAQVAEEAGPDDIVVVLGSFLTVGAAMVWLDARQA